MALECAHCGHRTREDVKRCPSCLRSSTLVALPDEPAPTRKTSRRRRALVALAATALVGGAIAGGLRLSRRNSATPAAVTQREHARGALTGLLEPSVLRDPLALGETAQSLTAIARQAGRDPLARARAVGDRLASMRRAARASPTERPPSGRTLEAAFTALTRGEALTSLELARLAAAALREAGTEATVAQRTVGLRVDEPADPTGVRGAYVALVAEHALDANADEPIVRARDAGAVALDEAALTGAIAVQAALSEALAPDARRDRALALADAAVEAWPDGAVPLAARGYVLHVLGVTAARGGPLEALGTALAVRDDAAVQLLRARVALARGDVVLAAQSAANALRRAPQWGPAALAASALDVARIAPEAGPNDRCAPLRAARDVWTDDAYALCQSDTPGSPDAPDEGARSAATQRLRDSSNDPLRLAYAAAHGAAEVTARVPPFARGEYGAWLRVLGRAELARALDAPDAATAR